MSSFSIKIINNTTSQYLTLDNSSSCKFHVLAEGLEGFDTPNFSVYSESSAIYDNSFIIGENTPDRNIAITALTKKDVSTDVALSELYQVLNTKDTYNIEFTSSLKSGTFELVDVKLEGLKAKPTSLKDCVEVTIGFYCPNPYWQDKEYTVKTLNQGSSTYIRSYYYFAEDEKKLFFNRVYPVFEIKNKTGSSYKITYLKFSVSPKGDYFNCEWTGSFYLQSGEIITLDCDKKFFSHGNYSLLSGIETIKDLESMYLYNNVTDSLFVYATLNNAVIDPSVFSTTVKYKKRYLSCF